MKSVKGSEKQQRKSDKQGSEKLELNQSIKSKKMNSARVSEKHQNLDLNIDTKNPYMADQGHSLKKRGTQSKGMQSKKVHNKSPVGVSDKSPQDVTLRMKAPDRASE